MLELDGHLGEAPEGDTLSGSRLGRHMFRSRNAVSLLLALLFRIWGIESR